MDTTKKVWIKNSLEKILNQILFMKFKLDIRKIDKKHILRTLVIVSILLFDVKLADSVIYPPRVSLILSILSIILLSTWWFWKAAKRIGLPRTPLSLPFITLVIIAILSTIFSVDFRISMDTTIGILSIVLIYFLLCDLLLAGWKEETFELALLIFVGYLLILGTREIFDHYKSWIFLRVQDYPLFLLRYRLYGIAEHPNLFAMLVYISLPFAEIRLARAKIFLTKIIWVVWVLLATIVMFFLNSRGGMVAISTALMITLGWLLFENGYPSTENFLLWLRKNLRIIIGTFVYASIFISLSITFQILSPVGRTLRHGSGISAGRLNFWQVALEMIKINPITGGGLSTYPRFYYSDFPSTGWIAPHAHNFYLDITAQLGIFGVLVLIWILVAVPIIILSPKLNNYSSQWEFDATNKDLLVASVAAIIAFMFHGLVENPTLSPHRILTLTIVIVIGLSSANLILPGEHNRFKMLPILIGIFAVVMVSTYALKQNLAHEAQISSVNLANKHKWQEASDFLEKAIKLDPKLSFYEEQLAFSNGVQAEEINDQDALNNGLFYYRSSIQKQPFWVLNYINYAALLELNKEKDKSLEVLESIPSNWLKVWYMPTFLLASKYEDIGENGKAAELFSSGIENFPWSTGAVICMQSLLCQEKSKEIIADDEIYHTHLEAMNLLDNGDPKKVITILEKIPIEQRYPIIWIDLANAHIKLGEFDIARYELKIADDLGVMGSDETRSYMINVFSDLLIQTGDPVNAQRFLNSVIESDSISRNYDLLVFHRIGFPELLLPSIKFLSMNKYDLKNFERLSTLSREYNQFENSPWVYEQEKLRSTIKKLKSTFEN